MHTKYKFVRVSDDGSKTISVIRAMVLSEVIEEFESFLRGCGFAFNGHIEIVDDENE